MNKTDILTGRIVQRVIDAKAISSKVIINHGVDYHNNINELIDNLFAFFPNSLITLKKLNFGYELRIEVDFNGTVL